MNADFAYLCDVLPNGYVVCDDHFIHLFGINSMQTVPFNLGTIDDPKDILLASDLTHDEREKMIEILKKTCQALTGKLQSIEFPLIRIWRQ